MSERATYGFTTLFFEATRRCNLSCPMCMASSNDALVVKRSKREELTTDEIERHVLATAREIGIRIITWSGGEVILRRDATELLHRATRYGYESTVCTNATRMTRDRLEELHEASGGTLVMALGINSIEDENAWTRDADCAETVKVLELCAELGIRRHVVVNVGRHNLETLDRTFQWPAAAAGSTGTSWLSTATTWSRRSTRRSENGPPATSATPRSSSPPRCTSGSREARGT